MLSGAIDIVLSSGGDDNYIIDVLGKGSVIGQNYFLMHEKRLYKGINNCSMTARILHIDYHQIHILRHMNRGIDKCICEQIDSIRTQGIGQIDYIIVSKMIMPA